ncbi:L-asparaginase II [Aspergillus welwitschiae]|uniref:L-asparaginase II n=1 Tax=Aspergillus welwitschiae TaxID=1341132 RepID=A0A3F3PMV0_9EURO|nr:L-asparaginase II [Aspergillus welwitschiae]RDH28082.1 L-asparaginase II [Aspergillus welwitschiae]
MSVGDDDGYVVSYRGEVVENRHKVHASVVDATGRLLFHVGDPSRITLARSAAKPAQTLAVLETGAFERFNLDYAELALMCASHSSEERHITRANSMLAKVQAKEDDLRCGGHPALSASVNHDWTRRGYSPTAICNNCSGKHVGMLAGTKAIGADLLTYHQPTHPLQLRVKRVFEELCDLRADDVSWCIDGCNLPAPAIPLHSLGRVYATLAAAADQAEKNASATARTRDLDRIFRAMTRYPELVGGNGRFCTVLMNAFQGRLMGKLGADGCYGIGIRASEQTAQLGAIGAVGISVKIEDGNIGILYSATIEILEQLGIRPPELCSAIVDCHRPSNVNTAGIVTGRVIPAFKLRAAI